MTKTITKRHVKIVCTLDPASSSPEVIENMLKGGIPIGKAFGISLRLNYSWFIVFVLVTTHNIKTVPRQQWHTRTVKEAMTPFENLKWVTPEQDLSTGLGMLTESDIDQVPVVKDRNIVGMVARDNLLSFVTVRSDLGI